TLGTCPLSLHDALPIFVAARLRRLQAGGVGDDVGPELEGQLAVALAELVRLPVAGQRRAAVDDHGLAALLHAPQLERLARRHARSEEHTSELQSPYDLV